MMLLNLLKALTLKRIFYTVLVIVFAGLVWTVHIRGEAYKAEVAARAQARTEHLAKVAAADRAAREKEQAAQAAFEEERKQWDEEKQKMEADIAGLRGNAERLRKTIAAGEAGYLSTGEGPGSTAGTDAPAKATWVVLGQCVSEYETLAKDADELNSRLSIAQRWAKTVQRQ